MLGPETRADARLPGQVINPTNGKVVTKISEGNAKDVDAAVDAAQKAFDSSWGTKVAPHQRGKLLMKLATLIEANVDELAALETLDNGKAFSIAKGFDIVEGAACLRYYGGWADKGEYREHLKAFLMLITVFFFEQKMLARTLRSRTRVGTLQT